MLKSQRQNEIIEILKKESFVTVAELSARLFASMPTVRRDLSALEEEGYLKRCHGGAMLCAGEENASIYFRREKSQKEKMRMCRVAAELVKDNDVIFIDASSTAFHISDFLSRDKDVTVVTNSLFAAERFAELDIPVYCTGGKLIKESFVFIGYAAEESARTYNADIMFFSAASLSDEGMISDWSDGECSMRVLMAGNAKTTVFMCDSTKFGRSSMFRLFPLDRVNYVVTDKPLPDALVRRFKLKCLVNDPAYLYEVKLK